MVTDVIPIREEDRSAHLDRGYIGNELLVPLINHNHRLLIRSRGGVSALRINHRIAHRRPFLVPDFNLERPGDQGLCPT